MPRSTDSRLCRGGEDGAACWMVRRNDSFVLQRIQQTEQRSTALTTVFKCIAVACATSLTSSGDD